MIAPGPTSAARCLANEPDVVLMDEPLGALDALTREKMQSLVLKLWKETGKTIILITHSVEEALLLGERLLVMAPRPGRVHTEYRLPFAELGVGADLREVKKHPDFGPKRDEILNMIWDMEEEIMGRKEGLIMLEEIGDLIVTTLWMAIGITGIFLLYVAIAATCAFAAKLITQGRKKEEGFNALKTVTFGDESSVTANRLASVLGVIAIFLLWGIATGSKFAPPILPGPHQGVATFEYTAVNAAGQTDKGTVYVHTHEEGETPTLTEIGAADGFAVDDVVQVKVRRSKLLKAQNNDEGGKEDGYRVTHIDGQPIEPDQTVEYDGGSIKMTKKGSLSIAPYPGMTMEALYLPPPEQVWTTFLDLNANGYQNVGLWENVFWSLARVVIGFAPWRPLRHSAGLCDGSQWLAARLVRSTG